MMKCVFTFEDEHSAMDFNEKSGDSSKRLLSIVQTSSLEVHIWAGVHDAFFLLCEASRLTKTVNFFDIFPT